MRKPLRSLRELAGDDSGVVGPVVAALGVTLLASAGLALDVGLYYSGNRNLRIATEAAALAAAMDPANAQTRAIAYLTRNGFDASVLKSVEVGYYCANDANAAVDNSGSRFFLANARPADCAGSTSNIANAVRIKTDKKSRQFLTGVLGGASPIPRLAATASAARIDEAGISATSGLLDISNPLVNTVNNLLGSLLGIKLILSTANIEALLGGNVDAGLFFDALGRRAGFTGTYGTMVQQSFQLRDIAAAAAEAAGSASTKTALNLIADKAPADYKVPLKGLFSVGIWRNMKVGDANAPPALRAGLNSYQLISYAVQDGPIVLDVGSVVKSLLPAVPLTGTEVKVGVAVSGHADRPRFAFGPANEAKVGSSMVRLKVDLTLTDIPILARVNVPVLIDIAAAEAQVNSIGCAGQANQTGNTTVKVGVKSSLVKAFIGDYYVNGVKTDPLIKPLPTIDSAHVQQTALVEAISLKPLGLPLALPTVLAVKGKAVVEPVLGSGLNDTLTFGPGGGIIGSPTTAGTGVAIPNRARIGTTVDSLVGSLTGGDGKDTGVQLCLLGACGILDIFGVKTQAVPAISKAVTGTVTALVDPLLDTVLIALGVQLGHETAWVNGVRCGVPVLI